MRPCQSGFAWQQRVGAFAALPALIRHLGGDPAVALIRAGLSVDALDDPQRRVSYEALGRLFAHSFEETGCAHFGLLAGRAWRLADLGLLGELVRHSPTVGRALRTLVAHQRMNSEGGLGFLLERGGYVDLGYAIYQPGLYRTDQLYDAHLSALFNFMRELCGEHWIPTEAFIPHAAPSTTLHYRNFLKVHPHFNAEHCALRFPAQWMRQPVEGADPERLRVAQQRARSVRRPEFIHQVFRALRMLLVEEQHSGDGVAQMLSMHRRTLNRRLKAEGTTFQRVLDQVRFDMARGFLANSDISLDDIAATLGYAGVSPFMRTFRRWAGTTPATWRRAHGVQRVVGPPFPSGARDPLLPEASPVRA